MGTSARLNKSKKVPLEEGTVAENESKELNKLLLFYKYVLISKLNSKLKLKVLEDFANAEQAKHNFQFTFGAIRLRYSKKKTANRNRSYIKPTYEEMEAIRLTEPEKKFNRKAHIQAYCKLRYKRIKAVLDADTGVIRVTSISY